MVASARNVKLDDLTPPPTNVGDGETRSKGRSGSRRSRPRDEVQPIPPSTEPETPPPPPPTEPPTPPPQKGLPLSEIPDEISDDDDDEEDDEGYDEDGDDEESDDVDDDDEEENDDDEENLEAAPPGINRNSNQQQQQKANVDHNHDHDHDDNDDDDDEDEYYDDEDDDEDDEKAPETEPETEPPTEPPTEPETEIERNRGRKKGSKRNRNKVEIPETIPVNEINEESPIIIAVEQERGPPGTDIGSDDENGNDDLVQGVRVSDGNEVLEDHEEESGDEGSGDDESGDEELGDEESVDEVSINNDSHKLPSDFVKLDGNVIEPGNVAKEDDDVTGGLLILPLNSIQKISLKHVFKSGAKGILLDFGE